MACWKSSMSKSSRTQKHSLAQTQMNCVCDERAIVTECLTTRRTQRSRSPWNWFLLLSVNVPFYSGHEEPGVRRCGFSIKQKIHFNQLACIFSKSINEKKKQKKKNLLKRRRQPMTITLPLIHNTHTTDYTVHSSHTRDSLLKIILQSNQCHNLHMRIICIYLRVDGGKKRTKSWVIWLVSAFRMRTPSIVQFICWLDYGQQTMKNRFFRFSFVHFSLLVSSSECCNETKLIYSVQFFKFNACWFLNQFRCRTIVSIWIPI